MTTQEPGTECPCGSGQAYRACCQPYHQGRPAPAPEPLMRSRYSAFVLKLPDYLQATWHPDTRPRALDLEQSGSWQSLRVLSSDESGDEGRVHFRAIYRAGKLWRYLEETSSFVRQAGRWYYLHGDTEEGPLKPGRNDPCPCGSGNKYKACCL